MRDDLVQQLAEAIALCLPGWPPTTNLQHSQAIARAVLASGLVVPTSDVLMLAKRWDHTAAGNQLRALTQQETR